MDRTHHRVKPSLWATSYLSDVLPHVLDHHFIGSDRLQSEQAPVVDVRLAESDPFLSELDGGGIKRARYPREEFQTNGRNSTFGPPATFS